jgi:hypothetical protein
MMQTRGPNDLLLCEHHVVSDIFEYGRLKILTLRESEISTTTTYQPGTSFLTSFDIAENTVELTTDR